MVSKEVYRYRVWELFASLEGFISLFITLSLAATISIGIWDDRIQIGTRLVSKSVISQPDEIRNIIQEVNELKIQLSDLTAKISLADSEAYAEDAKRLTEQLKELNSHVEKLLDFKPENE